MTSQPPPPPPGTPPAGPGGRQNFDPKAFNPLDWGILGAGVLAFLFSFIDYYDGVTVTAGGHSEDVNVGSASAWHDIFGGGFFAWFAMAFAVAGAIFVALELFSPQMQVSIGNRVAGLGLFALATLFEIIAIFVTPSYSYSGFGSSISASIDHGVGFWVSLIVIIAGTVLSLMRLQATGGQLPGGLGDKIPNLGGYGPQGGISGQSGAPRPTPGTNRDAPPPPPAPNA